MLRFVKWLAFSDLFQMNVLMLSSAHTNLISLLLITKEDEGACNSSSFVASAVVMINVVVTQS